VGANIRPELYENLRKKYPNDSDTAIIVKGLQNLCNEKVINLEGIDLEVWAHILDKIKKTKLDIRPVIAELLYRWTSGEFKVDGE
jgi:hypothetical protein